jgi:hypothetical protein
MAEDSPIRHPRCRRCNAIHSKEAGCASWAEILDRAKEPQPIETVTVQQPMPPTKQPWELAAEQDRQERRRTETVVEYQAGVSFEKPAS